MARSASASSKTNPQLAEQARQRFHEKAAELREHRTHPFPALDAPEVDTQLAISVAERLIDGFERELKAADLSMQDGFTVVTQLPPGAVLPKTGATPSLDAAIGAMRDVAMRSGVDSFQYRIDDGRQPGISVHCRMRSTSDLEYWRDVVM